MPSYVISQASGKIGEKVDAILCDPHGATNGPDRRTDVPVRISRCASEQVLYVDGEPRSVIACTGQNGTVTYLVNGSTKSLRNSDRRAALARAETLLKQLAQCLGPLRQTSDEPELATEALGLFFNWLYDERERLTEGARPHGGPQ